MSTFSVDVLAYVEARYRGRMRGDRDFILHIFDSYTGCTWEKGGAGCGAMTSVHRHPPSYSVERSKCPLKAILGPDILVCKSVPIEVTEPLLQSRAIEERVFRRVYITH